MSKLGKKLIQAAREGRAIARGELDPTTYRVHVPADVDVRKIRKELKLSQAEFAAEFGLSAATVRDWEQNRDRPEGAARGTTPCDQKRVRRGAARSRVHAVVKRPTLHPL